MIKKIIFFVCLAVFSSGIYAICPTYQLCFTPQSNCTNVLIQQINQAKKSIYVQSYAFTSYDLTNALIAAKRRGVSVNIIADKSQFDPQFRSASKVNKLLKANDIAIWKDSIDGLAHNKVMIFDESVVETGSFNFTYAAEKYNAENMLIIHDPNIAKGYLNNWMSRKNQAKLMR